jgi:hypothetical protein
MRSKYELQTQKTLQKDDWLVDFKIRPSRVYPNAPVDYWHLFDLIAWKPGELRFISVKGKNCPKQHKIDLLEFLVPKGVSIELWMYKTKIPTITIFAH